MHSSNPHDPPVIDPRCVIVFSDLSFTFAYETLDSYLEDENDIKTLIRGIRLLDDIAKKEPLASRLDPVGAACADLEHDLSKKTDAELEQFVRANVETLYHPACTARMAPLEDGGVTDPQLRVHGIPNLRIADASSYPSIVAGHTVSRRVALLAFSDPSRTC